MPVINHDNFITNVQDIKMFMGEYDGIQRFDRYKHPIFEQYYNVMESLRWTPKELNFSSDKVGYKKLPIGIQQIYDLNLMSQTLTDSLIARFIDGVIMEYVSDPGLELVLSTQANFELLHSFSYSYNIRQVYPNPTKLFNEYLQSEVIRNRLSMEEEVFNSLHDRFNNAKDTSARKRLLIEALIHQLALESVRFFVSFLYTFKINAEYGQIQGTANNITLIAQDENIHVTIYAKILELLKTDSSEGFSHILNTPWYNDKIKSIFNDVIESELGWFRELNSRDQIEGMNEHTIFDFLNYYAQKAMSAAKIEGTERVEQNELVRFFEQKRNINARQTAAQETDQLSYNIGVLEDGEFEDTRAMLTNKIDPIAFMDGLRKEGKNGK